jgi:N-acetylmuramoyl-L-alanine amidase
LKSKGDTAIVISIHVNAAGNGGWFNATGWSAYTTKGKTTSDKLAECLYDAAVEVLKDKKIRVDNSDGDRDYESDFYIIKHSNCPAVLTENFFMDSKKDIDYLLSDQGK